MDALYQELQIESFAFRCLISLILLVLMIIFLKIIFKLFCFIIKMIILKLQRMNNTSEFNNKDKIISHLHNCSLDHNRNFGDQSLIEIKMLELMHHHQKNDQYKTRNDLVSLRNEINMNQIKNDIRYETQNALEMMRLKQEISSIKGQRLTESISSKANILYNDKKLNDEEIKTNQDIKIFQIYIVPDKHQLSYYDKKKRILFMNTNDFNNANLQKFIDVKVLD